MNTPTNNLSSSICDCYLPASGGTIKMGEWYFDVFMTVNGIGFTVYQRGKPLGDDSHLDLFISELDGHFRINPKGWFSVDNQQE